MKITIIGAGAFGMALGGVLLENKHELSFFDPYKFPAVSLNSALKNSEAILFVAPSKTAQDTIKNLSKEQKSLPFICASKGFLSTKPFKTLENFSILSGPAFAKDLNKKKPTTLTASDFFIKKLFRTDWLNIELCHDKKGILLCGSLKNIYAIYAGIHNLHEGTVKYRTFINDSIRELKKILTANFCNPNTVMKSCGIGDLSLTASSKNSRNYQFGQLLAKSQNEASAQVFSDNFLKENTVEGLNALETIEKLAKNFDFIIPDNLPILEEIWETYQISQN